jgi:hypothetical protein
MAAKKKLPTVFGPTFPGDYPSEMRRQMWPLCCGAAIASGFKHAGGITDDELDAEIKNMLTALPDFQIYHGEHMQPHLTFLTLNSSQMASAKIMKAVEKAGFKKIGEGKPRGSPQGFFLRDTSNTWKAA